MTRRDIEILIFINRFGKCTVEQVSKYFGMSVVRGYQVLQRSRKAGLLIFERVFHNEKGIYMCSNEGAKFTEMEKIRDINVASLRHDLMIADRFLELMDSFDVTYFRTERELRQDKSLEHFPDMLIKVGEELISIEVELTRKSKTRMNQIRNFYLKATFIDKIIYYTPNHLKAYVNSFFGSLDMVEIHEL